MKFPQRFRRRRASRKCLYRFPKGWGVDKPAAYIEAFCQLNFLTK